MPPKPRGRHPKCSHSWVRGEKKTPLKYIMNVLLLDFEYFIEKYLTSRQEFGFSIIGTKSTKKYCHVGTLKAFHLWTLGTSV